MDEAEEQVQKNVIAFCKILPKHVEAWTEILQQSVNCVEGLSNQAEQLRYVEKAILAHTDSFQNVQNILRYLIIEGIEEHIVKLRGFIIKLNNINNELKNKLTVLEQSTVMLDMEKHCSLVQGSATQPSLPNLLQHSLEFWNAFSAISKNINDSFKNLDVRSEKSVSDFEKSLKVDLEDTRITNLVALTQYVDNEKNIL